MKTKDKIHEIQTREEYEEKINLYAKLEARLALLEDGLLQDLQKVRERYEERISGYQDQMSELYKQCALYAAKNTAKLMKPGSRSGETAQAYYGFSLGNPTLKLLNSRHTWKSVCAAIRARGEDFAARFLILPDPKPNKDEIKAALSDAELAAIGCRIEQTDKFYIKAKE